MQAEGASRDSTCCSQEERKKVPSLEVRATIPNEEHKKLTSTARAHEWGLASVLCKTATKRAARGAQQRKGPALGRVKKQLGGEHLLAKDDLRRIAVTPIQGAPAHEDTTVSQACPKRGRVAYTR